MPKAITYNEKKNKIRKTAVSFQPPQYVVVGRFIGKYNGLPVVDDSAVRIATEKDEKRIKYRLEAQMKHLPTIIKKKKSSFDNFNAVLAELKNKKNSNIKLTRIERLRLWKMVKENIKNGNIKPSKTHQKSFITQFLQ